MTHPLHVADLDQPDKGWGRVRLVRMTAARQGRDALASMQLSCRLVYLSYYKM